jgi:hypothetical protein
MLQKLSSSAPDFENNFNFQCCEQTLSVPSDFTRFWRHENFPSKYAVAYSHLSQARAL